MEAAEKQYKALVDAKANAKSNADWQKANEMLKKATLTRDNAKAAFDTGAKAMAAEKSAME